MHGRGWELFCCSDMELCTTLYEILFSWMYQIVCTGFCVNKEGADFELCK